MKFLLRKYQLLRLRWQEYVLECEAAHAYGLLQDHERRLKATLWQLGTVRRRLALVEEPEVLLREVA